MNPKTRELLEAPFPEAVIKWKPIKLHPKEAPTRALCVPYISVGAVIERLNQIEEGWTFDLEKLNGDNAAFLGTLIIEGNARKNIGSADDANEQIDEDKTGASDALKRCASLFGVGLYLRDLPRKWMDYDAKTKTTHEPAVPPNSKPPNDQKQETTTDDLTSNQIRNLRASIKKAEGIFDHQKASLTFAEIIAPYTEGVIDPDLVPAKDLTECRQKLLAAADKFT